MRSRLAFFILAFIGIVLFSLSFGKSLGDIGGQSVILGLQGKLAQACEPPPGGCPEGKYFDFNDCQCRSESSGSSCEEPGGGCGPDHYWDFNVCDCVYSGATTSPSATPEPSVSSAPEGCSEPSGGCPNGKYWDSYSCSCKSESSCNPPSTGCGPDKYWDSYACDCKDSCYEPAGGCGVDKYWDYSDCNCRSYNSCSPPGGGCGTNYYWDSYYCDCKPYEGTQETSSCTPPAAGCGIDYYWDSYSCNCKQYPSYYSCEEPTGGCGIGWYWDNTACACYSSSDDDVYYTAYYSPNVLEEDLDRFAYESSDRINCVRSILTPTEYERLRYLVPTNETEQAEIHQLGDRVKSCWDLSDSFSDQALFDDSTSKSPLEAEKCLVDTLGESVYREIYKGEREPTYEEHLLFEACFGNINRDTINYVTNDQALPGPVDSCLRSVLDGDLYEDIKEGRSDVPYELRDEVDRCFGVDPQPFDEGRSYTIPDEVESCLKQAVGESRFEEINSGQSEPTSDERNKGDACFDRLNEDQVKFLLPPPEQIPYLVPDPEVIEVEGFLQDTREIDGKVIGGRVVFSGKGPPNSTVNIYIFSEPIVVTTTTDENGDWVYELNQPLEGEKHVAYATVRNESGDLVRSSVFDFTVTAAEPGAGQLLQEEGKAIEETTRFLTYALALTAFVVVIAGGGAAYLFLKRSKPRGKNILPGDGKGEGDTGSGTVN